MKESLSRKEKLKSRKQIEHLFSSGKAIKAYPLMAVYSKILPSDGIHYKAGFSVSKKRFKRAVDRNRIKRLMREAYRRKKSFLPENPDVCYGFMFVYLSRKEVSLVELEEKILEIFKRFEMEVNKTKDI